MAPDLELDPAPPPLVGLPDYIGDHKPMRPTRLHLFVAVVIAIGGAACTTSEEEPTAALEQTTAQQEVGEEATSAPANTDETTDETTDEESAGSPTDLTLTPEQTEGPYYPVEVPTDTDNNLRQVFDGAIAEGNRLDLQGAVIDPAGQPLPNAVVEIWQTDANGAYLHPEDPRRDLRDPDFQSFGTSVTDEDGNYQFETILPGVYENRPAHIHLKVLYEGSELLTSQIYFSGDDLLGDDAIAGAVTDDELALLTANLLDADEGFSAVHDLVVQP